MTHFDKAILTVLSHEGGFVDDPVDPGGATNWGISLRFLKSAGDLNNDGILDGDIDGDGDVDYDDIKKMTRRQAIDIYKLHFWDKYKYDTIVDYSIAERTFDMCVNMGSSQAAKLVQRALQECGHKHIVDDGILGNLSFTAINATDPSKLLKEIRLQHVLFYLNLIAQKPQFEKYKKGWLRRACS